MVIIGNLTLIINLFKTNINSWSNNKIMPGLFHTPHNISKSWVEKMGFSPKFFADRYR